MFAKNLRYLRSKEGIGQTELALELGRKSPSSVCEWEKGRYTPKLPVLTKIADIFDVSFNELVSIDLEERDLTYTADSDSEDQLVEVGLYGTLSAGTGQKIYDNPVETVTVKRQNLPMEDYDIMLKIVGDSMEPAFMDGEYVFIKKTDYIRPGQFVAAIVDGEAYLKKIVPENDKVRLVSLNKNYDDIIVTDNESIDLVGVVVL